jgi:MATE family multidrug resistance protein
MPSSAEENAPAASSPLASWVPRFLRRPQQNDSKGLSERTFLIPKPSSSSSSSSLSRADGVTYAITPDDDPKWDPKAIGKEFLVLLKMSIPVILAYTLQNSLQTISVLLVGRSSPENLATAAFAYMFATATGWLIALGGTTALDTLCSSSFTGSKNPYELGILLQRAFIVLGAMYIPVAILWWFSEPVFIQLGQSPQLSRESAMFLRCLIPGGLGYIYFESTKKFLQTQGIMKAGTYVLLITSPLSALLNYLFVYVFRLGLIGAPLATGLSYWLSFLLLVCYARFVGGWERWGGFDRACFRNIWVFARLAGLGFIMVGTEWVCTSLFHCNNY